MSKITMISGHYLDSKRKAGFHHIANAFIETGNEVLFFTAPVSKLHKLKNDHIFQYPIEGETNQIVKKGNIQSYLHYTPFHIANTRFLLSNILTTPLVSFYSKFSIHKEAESFIQQSEYIIFESTPGLFLFKKFKSLNAKAKYIYRVSDDLRFLKVHPALIDLEKNILPKFDLVSIVSPRFFNFMKGDNVKLHFHGINKAVFNQTLLNPYPENTENMVFVGNAYFDVSFLEIASNLFPNVKFHIIGPIHNLPKSPNIKGYGELPFINTVPYIKFASAGLHTLELSPGADAFTDTLKVHQYTFCKLPIIAPSFLKSNRGHAFYYQPGDIESIRSAVGSALNFPHSLVENENVLDWKELAKRLIED